MLIKYILLENLFKPIVSFINGFILFTSLLHFHLQSFVFVTDLNDKQQQQQTAIWELIKTEVAYIKTLKVVTDVGIILLNLLYLVIL